MKRSLVLFSFVFTTCLLMLFMYKAVITRFVQSLLFPLTHTIPTYSQKITIGNGDVNNDGAVNDFDISLILNNQGKVHNKNVDQYSDGKVNAFDFAVSAQAVSPASYER